MPRPLAVAAYGIVAIAIAFELVTVWLMLHPNVSADYRGYYIDQTTTCLNQPVSGQYTLGTVVSFLPDGKDQAQPIKVCGWEGPVGDGTHALGTSSRLRFVVPNSTPSLALTLKLIAIDRDGFPQQRVDVDVNGTVVTSLTVLAGVEDTFVVPIPADLVTVHLDTLDVTLLYPDAIKMGPNDSNTRWRSIKLLAAGLAPAP